MYWATSGWDLGLLLDAEAPVEALRTFVEKHPKAPDIRLIRYSLAVRLAREERYEEAASIYEALNARQWAARMRQTALLHREAKRSDLPAPERLEARYRLAEFLAANPERIFFNDALWRRFQQYALLAEQDSRLTRAERQKLTAAERKLKDEQEERWRAYVILREVVREAGPTDLGHRAARLAVRCLRRISVRFGRGDEIRAADVELSAWLRRFSPAAAPGRQGSAGRADRREGGG